MSVIKREEYLLGIKYWAQWYFHRVPQFELFRYIGVDKNVGIYYFQSVKTRSIVGKGFYQLNMNGFKPFLLDFKRITETEHAAT